MSRQLEAPTSRSSATPTGKALPSTLLDLVAVLRPPPRALFTGRQGPLQVDQVRLRMQPDAGVTFTLLVNQPGS